MIDTETHNRTGIDMLFAQADLPPQMFIAISPVAAVIIGAMVGASILGGFYAFGAVASKDAQNLRTEIAAARADQIAVTERIIDSLAEMGKVMAEFKIALAVMEARQTNLPPTGGFHARPRE